MESKQELITQLEDFVYQGPEEKESLDRLTAFVKEYDNLYGRDNLHGHITASAWIVDPRARATLLIFHKKLKLWLQPGGHIEADDTSLLISAIREAREETGIQDIEVLSPSIFDVDVHWIPARKEVPGHWHYDVRFLLKGNGSEVIHLQQEEVDAYQWKTWEEVINSSDMEFSLVRMARKCVGM